MHYLLSLASMIWPCPKFIYCIYHVKEGCLDLTSPKVGRARQLKLHGSPLEELPVRTNWKCGWFPPHAPGVRHQNLNLNQLIIQNYPFKFIFGCPGCSSRILEWDWHQRWNVTTDVPRLARDHRRRRRRRKEEGFHFVHFLHSSEIMPITSESCILRMTISTNMPEVFFFLSCCITVQRGSSRTPARAHATVYLLRNTARLLMCQVCGAAISQPNSFRGW